MKKLICAVCLTFGVAAFANAQTQQPSTATQPQSQEQTRDQDHDKERISVVDLPENIRTSLEGQDYSGWTVSNAYRKTKSTSGDASASSDMNASGEMDKTMYVVELSNGSETKMVKFDEQGNKIKEKDKNKDQK